MGDMFAAKVLTRRSRRFCLDMLSNHVPSPLHVGIGTRHLEVINVDNKEQSQSVMEIATAPLLDRLETHLRQHGIAVLFPISASIGMSVQGQDQGTHRITELGPARRLPIPRQAHPRRLPPQLGLDVSLLSITLLNAVSRQGAVRIGGLTSLHGSR